MIRKIIMNFTIIIIIIYSLSCSSKRPHGEVCCKTEPQISKAVTSPATTEEPASTWLLQSFEEHIEKKYNKDKGKGFIGEAPREKVVSLSAGGQFGAFGAGFVIGWFRTGAMPEFDVVTSVSTGSLLAPFVFLLSGKSQYKEEIIVLLNKVYGEGLEDSDVFEESIASNLINKKALYDRAPLRKLLEKELKSEYLDEIAEEYPKKKRFLLMGTVSLDTGDFKIVDLTKLAYEYKGKTREKLFIDTMMASSAVPIIFPPVFINGEMYIDGGAREYVFFKTVEDVINRALINKGLTDVDKTFYMIVHGDFYVEKLCTSYSLKGIATRSMSIVLDQILRASVFYNAYLANSLVKVNGNKWKSDPQKMWGVKVMDARNNGCKHGSSDNLFDPIFTKCLYERGLQLGLDPNKRWITEMTELAKLLEEVKEPLEPSDRKYPNSCP